MFAVRNTKTNQWWSTLRNRWVHEDLRQKFYDVTKLPDFIQGHALRTYKVDNTVLQYIDIKTMKAMAEVVEIVPKTAATVEA